MMAVIYPSLNGALARALGVPPGARRAVLTLEIGQLPTLDVELLAEDQPSERPACDVQAVAAVPFILRMRFEPAA